MRRTMIATPAMTGTMKYTKPMTIFPRLPSGMRVECIRSLSSWCLLAALRSKSIDVFECLKYLTP